MQPSTVSVSIVAQSGNSIRDALALKEIVMISVQQIQARLLDQDGGCRDINFENPTWDGATNLIRWFLQNYTLISATTGQGTDIKADLANSQAYTLSVSAEEYIHLVGENSKELISDLQIFISNPQNGENGAPFVELTFFPDALSETFSGSGFVHFVEEMKQRLQASRYYVRYENASWRFGSSGLGTGVIFQSGDVKDIA